MQMGNCQISIKGRIQGVGKTQKREANQNISTPKEQKKMTENRIN